MELRAAAENDLPELLQLYAQFGKDALVQDDPRAADLWQSILSDRNHHVLVASDEERLVSSCVLVIVPNLTHGGRPYGVIENVVTDAAHRKKGYGTAVLNAAKALATCENCYKLMLMTGSKQEGTLLFYERAGYNRTDKTAFVQWL